MSLLSQLEADLKQAMLARNSELTGVLRMLKSALKNEMIAQKSLELSDEDFIKILKREAKKRQDSIVQYTQGGRADLAETEEKELVLIKKYLPEEMSEDKIRSVVAEVLSGLGEVNPSQFGQIMSAVMKVVGSTADGTLVSKVVKEMLNK